MEARMLSDRNVHIINIYNGPFSYESRVAGIDKKSVSRVQSFHRYFHFFAATTIARVKQRFASFNPLSHTFFYSILWPESKLWINYDDARTWKFFLGGTLSIPLWLKGLNGNGLRETLCDEADLNRYLY